MLNTMQQSAVERMQSGQSCLELEQNMLSHYSKEESAIPRLVMCIVCAANSYIVATITSQRATGWGTLGRKANRKFFFVSLSCPLPTYRKQVFEDKSGKKQLCIKAPSIQAEKGLKKKQTKKCVSFSWPPRSPQRQPFA